MYNNINITFKLDEERYLEANNELKTFTKRKKHSMMGAVVYSVLIYSITYTFFCTFYGWDNIVIASQIYLIIAIPITLFLAYNKIKFNKRYQSRIIKEFREDRFLREIHNIIINQNDILIQTNISHANLLWNDIIKIVKTKNYLYLFRRQDNAFIIPLDSTEVVRDELFEIMKQKIKKKNRIGI